MVGVLLGLIDGPVLSHQSTSWDVSKAGGHPDWMKAADPPTCQECKRTSTLVVQVYCPLEGSPYHRTLYLFACTTIQCLNKSHSWWVFRSQLRDKTFLQQESNVPVKVENDSWGVEMDDWGDEEEADPEPKAPTPPQPDKDIDDLASSIADVSVSQDDDNCVAEEMMDPNMCSITALFNPPSVLVDSDTDSHFRALYLSVVEEPVDETEDFQHERHLLQQYTNADSSGAEALSRDKSSKGSAASEVYEKEAAKHGDKMFHKFVKRLSRCPQQVLRYSSRGTPLPISPIEVPSLCMHCGSSLAFEMQILPSLIPCLNCKNSDATVDFGTVLIYTCTASCWDEDDNVRSECAVLQIDPDSLFFTC